MYIWPLASMTISLVLAASPNHFEVYVPNVHYIVLSSGSHDDKFGTCD